MELAGPADPPPLPDLLALRWAIEACMRACISGGMLAIICCICSGDIPGGIPWGLMPCGFMPDDPSGAEGCGAEEFSASVESPAAAAASFFFDSAASIARITLLLAPAWLSACKPAEERSNWVSLAAMAATIGVSASPAFTIFMTSAFVRGFFCWAVRAVTVRKTTTMTPARLVTRINNLRVSRWTSAFRTGFRRKGPNKFGFLDQGRYGGA